MVSKGLSVSEFLSKYFTGLVELRVEANISDVPQAFRYKEVFSGTVDQFFRSQRSERFSKRFSFILTNDNVRIRVNDSLRNTLLT